MSVTKELLLAKRSKGSSSGKKKAATEQRVEWVGFVNCELTAAHKDDLAAGAFESAAAWEEVDALLWDRYKLTVTVDVAHDCYIVSLTCNKPGDSNAGLTLTARGGTMVNAVRALAYKHRKVLDGDWASFVATPGKGAVDFG